MGFSQNTNSSLSDIEGEIANQMKRYDAVGLAVAVVKENKIVYSKGFGNRDLEKKLPVTVNTVFPIGSITKSFTGTLLGILEGDNKVSLKDKPSLYIPNFQFYNEKMNNLITIEDLLSHKSGIGNQGTTQIFFPENDKLKTVQRLKYLKPEGEIKNSFVYSNMAYTVAGTIVEQITNKSWDSNIEEKLFNPLKMKSSFTDYSKMKATNNFSYGYGLFNGQIEKVMFENMNSIGPAGAIKSTVLDMSNWMIAWLNKGNFKGQKIIPTVYFDQATRAQNIKNDNFEEDAFLFADGFGWRLRSSYGRFRVEHGGNNYGFSSELMMFPFEKIGIVVLTNQDNSILPFIVADIVARRLLELEPETEYPIKVTEIYKPNPENKGFNQDEPPTHSLKNFSGVYSAKGFGKIEIGVEENKLFATFPTFKFQLEHLNHNTFYLKGTDEFKDVFNPEFTVDFELDTNGNISTFRLHSQKEPVEFKKNM